MHEDGSPFQLNFDAPDLGVTFEGRLATAKTLSLVGTVSLSGTSLHQALDWMGVDTGRDGQSWRVTFGKGSARYPDYRPAAR